MNYFISSSSYGHSIMQKRKAIRLNPLFIRHILSFIRQFGYSIHLETFYHAKKEGYPPDSSFYPSHFEFYPPVWTFYPLRAILSRKKRKAIRQIPLFIRHILSFIHQFGHSIHLETFYHAKKEGYPPDSSFYPSHFEFYPPVWAFYPLRDILSRKKGRLSARFLFLSVTF